MTAKDVKFSTDARDRMLRGVDILANAVKAGDKILIAKYSGSEVKLVGKDHIIVREDDVLGVLEEGSQ